MECKFIPPAKVVFCPDVLIGSEWNVNPLVALFTDVATNVLIGSEWNVNTLSYVMLSAPILVLIGSEWNVNLIENSLAGIGCPGFNRIRMECKFNYLSNAMNI